MNTSKHTPGPWIVDEEGRMVEAQLPNLRNEYEHICDLRGGIRGQINTANAHLIAAAPAMYEALRSIPDHALDCKHSYPHTLACWNCIVKAALAQAEGKQ